MPPFDEAFYLAQNPDVAAAVERGEFSSGEEHFIRFGQAEGRQPAPSAPTNLTFNEEFYLQANPGVAAAVERGEFSSGLEHFLLFGQAEGRLPIPFDETFYLQENPGVAAAVERGEFSSGLEHFLLFGQAEGRLPLPPDGNPPLPTPDSFDSGVFNFEGIGNFNPIGLLGGISFSENALALVDSDNGGEGNFEGNPSGDTVIAYAEDDFIGLDVTAPGPFAVGQLSFFYSSPREIHQVRIFDAGGNLLPQNVLGQPLAANAIALPPTPESGSEFGPFIPITIQFQGDARRIELGSVATEIGFDNLSLILTPAGQPPPPLIPQPPEAISDVASTAADSAVAINLLGNDESGGDAIALIGLSPLANGTGTLVNNGDGTVTYTPNPGIGNVSDSFTYTIANSQNFTDTTTVIITVEPPNQPPVANDDAAATAANTPVTVIPLANDFDPDGDPIFLSDVATATANGGTIVSDPNDALIYTPAETFAGIDSFTYTLSDGQDTDTATVTVTVNPPPTADLSVTKTVDSAAVTGGAIATYSIALTNAGPDTATSIVVSDRLPGGLSLENAATSLGTYNSDTGNWAIPSLQVGETATLTISAAVTSNVVGESITNIVEVTAVQELDPDSTPNNNDPTEDDRAAVTIAVVNNPPVANDDVTSTVANASVGLNVLENDTDPDGDSISLTDVAATSVNGGTITRDDANNLLIYTPAAGFTGTDSFTYTISDNLGSNATATVTIAVDAEDNPGSISGTKFVDANANGVRDADEGTLPGVTIFLDANNNSQLDAGETSTVTDADGNYEFADLPAGTYILREVLPEGFTQTFPGAIDIPADGFADEVLEFFDSGVGSLPGPYGGTLSSFPVPVSLDVVLGDDSENVDFLSLPTGSSVTVAFNDETAIDGPGDDIAIAETTAAGERADIFVSANLVDFTFLGTAEANVTTGFDLAAIGFAEPVRAVRVVGLDNGGLSAGFDLVNVQILPQSIGPAAAAGTGGHLVTLGAGEVVANRDFGNSPDGGTMPIANSDAATTFPGIAVTIDVLSNDVDPNEEALEIADFAAASANGGTITRDDSNTPDDLADDLLIYTPAANFTGLDTFIYTISDSRGGFDTAIVSIDVQPIIDNIPPVAANDFVTTTENTAVEIFPLTNDFDNNGDSLTIDGVAAVTVNGGTVAQTGDRLTYTPAEGFAGTDSFTYTISDGQDPATATINVTVENRSGSIGGVKFEDADADGLPDPGEVGLSGFTIYLDLNGNNRFDVGEPSDITDINGFYNISGLLPGTYSVREVQQPGFAQTTPNTDVNLGAGETEIVNVGNRMTDVNISPIAADDFASANANAAIAIDVLANDFDEDGDILEIAGVDDPVGGSAEITSDNQLLYTPDLDFTGEDAFAYTVSDGRGGSDAATVTVTIRNIINLPPVGVGDTATIRTGNSIAIAVLENDSDPENDPIFIAGVGDPAGGTVVIDGETLIYTPDAGFVGDDPFAYTLSDGLGGASTAIVTVTVQPGPEIPVAIDDLIIASQNVVNAPIPVLDNDFPVEPDGDPLTVTGVRTMGVGGGTPTISGDRILYTPPTDFVGEDAFAYTITDALGGSSSAVAIVDVRSVESPILGTANADRIVGNDLVSINGEQVPETLQGAAGNDTILGGGGGDILFGGTGGDLFVYRDLADSGADPVNPFEQGDSIEDFNPTVDRLLLDFEVSPGNRVDGTDVGINLIGISEGVAAIALTVPNTEPNFLPEQFTILLDNLPTDTTEADIRNAIVFDRF